MDSHPRQYNDPQRRTLNVKSSLARLYSAVLAVVRCLAGCLSRSCIVSKRLKIVDIAYGMQINSTQLKFI